MMNRGYMGLVAVAFAIVSVCSCSRSNGETSLGSSVTAPQSIVATGSEERCSALVGKKLDAATVDHAEVVERGTALFGVVQRLLIKVVWHAFPGLDAPADFCRVTAKIRAVPGSEISVEAWLPQQWNGKLVANGGGGFNGGMGGVAPIALANSLRKGYATFVTDAGHKESKSAKFAYENPEQFIDFAWRANHIAAGFAKELAGAYYSTPVKRAYFDGCSNGGRDAVMEARRFPEDYDGILAGAPAVSWSRLSASFAWNDQVIHRYKNANKLSDKLQLVQDAVIQKCDKLDGVQDKLIENPANCAFDPGELQCKSGDDASCLNSDEVAVLRKLYAGPKMRDGTRVYPGLSPGGEALPNNWTLWLLSGEKAVQSQMATEGFRWMIYGNPKWENSQFDLDRDYPAARKRLGSLMDADDPDLSGFVRRGGKLMLWHGWNDAALAPTSTINYYESVRATLGPAVDDQVKLFMIPGMMHCFGGVGPSSFDRLDEMDRWVESGTAPERIVATEYDQPGLVSVPGAKVVRTRPLCAWPKQAKYNGSGSTDDAENFSCK